MGFIRNVMNGLKLSNFISNILQLISSIGLFFLAIILITSLAKDICILGMLVFNASSSVPTYYLLEGITTYFLYFEFIALIIMYFKSEYQFPLQYFIHIAIAALIRLIVIEHKDPVTVFIYASTILLMVIALYIASQHVGSWRSKRESAVTLWRLLFLLSSSRTSLQLITPPLVAENVDLRN